MDGAQVSKKITELREWHDKMNAQLERLTEQLTQLSGRVNNKPPMDRHKKWRCAHPEEARRRAREGMRKLRSRRRDLLRTNITA